MARKTALGAVIALALLGAPPAAAQPAGDYAAAVVRPAVVTVTVDWHGWVRDRNSGEVFGGISGYSVTASRCVHTGVSGGGGALFDAAIAELTKVGRIGDPAKAKQALAGGAVAEGATPDTPIDRSIKVERTVSGNQRDIAPATVVDLVAPDDGDIAVLKIPRDRLPAAELRPDALPAGTPVIMVGPSIRSGQISGTRRGRPGYELSANAETSGGPVVDGRGRVVGLASQPANLAGAASIIMDLLRGKGITPSQSAYDRNYRAGLDRYFAGDLDGAVEYFDAVLDAAPTDEPAAEYRRLAIDRGGSAGHDVLVVITIACAGLAVAAGALGAAASIIRRQRLVLSIMDTPPSGFPLPITEPEEATVVSGSAPPAPPQPAPPP
jgi:serine protease Do